MAEVVVGRARRFRPQLSLAPLRSRGYRLLFAAESTSVFGDAFHAVAVPWLVYQLGGGARELGLMVAAYGLCRLATTPLGGILSDRIGPWQVMLVSDLSRMLLTVAIVTTTAVGVRDLLVVGTLVAATGLGAGLFQPAAYAITPRLLPPEQLQAGNALHSTATFAAGLVGPGVAGLLVTATSPAVAFGVDAVTFAVSAACLAAIGAGWRRGSGTTGRDIGIPAAGPATQRPDARADDVTVDDTSTDAAVVDRTVPDGAEGPSSQRPARSTFLALLRRSSLLRTVLVVTAAANLTVGGMVRVGLPSLASSELAAGAAGFGGLLAAFTGGSLAGGLFSAGLAGLRRRGATAMLSGVVLAAAVTAVPFVGYLGALVFLAVAGVASTVTNVLVITIVQTHTPAELLGRVMSAILFAALGLFPLSTVVAGLLVSNFGSPVVFVTTGAALLVAFGYGYWRPELRRAA